MSSDPPPARTDDGPRDGEQTLEQVVEEVHPRLVGALALYCGDVAVAEDCAQEALIRLWSHRHRVDDPGAWAYRCAFNLVSSVFRRRTAERRAVARLAAGSPLRASDPTRSADQRLDLERAIAALPARQRQAVLLRYLADFDVDRVALTMDCAPGTAKSHLARALDALRHSGLTGDPAPTPARSTHAP